MASSTIGFASEGRCLIYLTGPSVSKHYLPYNDRFSNFHLGLGVEAYFQKGRWLLGGNGHFMFNDSNDRAAYWIGVAPGYMAGNPKKLWGSLAVIAGGLKKAWYNGGRFSLFALPYLCVGFNRAGLNIGYIPRIHGVTAPILLVQLKLLVYPLRRL
jgi:hypothetical protein